jgi:hypothetical protein
LDTRQQQGSQTLEALVHKLASLTLHALEQFMKVLVELTHKVKHGLELKDPAKEVVQLTLMLAVNLLMLCHH